MEPEGWIDKVTTEEWNPIAEAGRQLAKEEPDGPREPSGTVG